MPQELDEDSARQKFDRLMRLWESARSASRAAEDRYVEIAWGSTLREESRRQRRALGLSAVVTLAMSVLGLKPTSIPALGIQIEGLQRLVLVGAGVGFTLYFLVEFLAYAARDFGYWRQRVRVARRELLWALEYEEGQAKESFPRSGAGERFAKEAQDKRRMYEKDILKRTDRWLAPVLGVGRMGWIEYRLPSVLGLVAILVGIASIVSALHTATPMNSNTPVAATPPGAEGSRASPASIPSKEAVPPPPPGKAPPAPPWQAPPAPPPTRR